jgi:hypothetical protein
VAKVFNNAFYNPDREIELNQVTSGHTILLKSPMSITTAYVVCKIGNTLLDATHPTKTVVLVNIITGRIVLKEPTQRCVLISSIIQLENYNRG